MTNKCLALIIPLLLSACGYNVKVIDTYQKSSNSITSDFTKISSKTIDLCHEKAELEKTKSTIEWVDSASAKASAISSCQKLSEATKSVNLAATAISAYASSLALLAGVDPKYINDDLSNLSKTANDLKDSEGNEVISKDKLTALSKLVSLISQAITTQAVKAKMIESIQSNKETINDSALSLKTYATSTYPSYIKANITLSTAINNILNSFKTSTKQKPELNERLIYRLAQREFSNKKDALKNDLKASDEFGKSIDAFIKANNDLADSFEKLDKNAQLKSVLDLAEQAKELKASVKKINEAS